MRRKRGGGGKKGRGLRGREEDVRKRGEGKGGRGGEGRMVDVRKRDDRKSGRSGARKSGRREEEG